MVVTATSAANHCLYCVVAHGAILRIYEKKPLVADQVAINYRKADITPRQRAMLDFAMKVCQTSHAVDEDDLRTSMHTGLMTNRLGHRWHHRVFGLSNRVANVTGMAPNPRRGAWAAPRKPKPEPGRAPWPFPTASCRI